MDNPSPTNLLAESSSTPPRFVTQPQDHFDSSNVNKWQQAYYVNEGSWTPGSSAEIFLCVGGEGPPIDGSAVTGSVHCNIAVEWLGERNALMFALEHRYYGCHNMSACPVDNFDDQKDALKYLSSRQAVEDVASFVQQMNKAYGLSSKNKWVTWGGSYPGMMAGWSRLQHPELIHASVASSAPVHAKLDMSEYNDAAADAYAVEDNDVGGSAECSASIRTGHKILEDALKKEGGSEVVENLIGVAKGSLSTKDQQRNVLGGGLAYFPSQGNDPSCTSPACNIKKICEIMLDTSLGDEVKRLVSLRQVQESQGSFSKLKAKATDNGQPDYWFYQTCTEFGFYQSCEVDSKCMYVRGLVTVESQADGCAQYGITIADIEKNINATNAHYGGLSPKSKSGKLGSCVLWPNGEVDPWARLSVLTSPGEAQPVAMVPGASHHAWTHPSASTDQASVIASRNQIRTQVLKFLELDCSETQVDSIVV